MQPPRVFLGAFGVSIPAHQVRSSDALFELRDVVTKTFAEVWAEHVHASRHEIVRIEPHFLVSSVTHGSLVLQLLVQGILDLPWADLVQRADGALRVLERIGAIAGGLGALKLAGDWISRRTRDRDARDVPERPGTGHITVTQQASITVAAMALSQEEDAEERVRTTIRSKTPQSLLVVVDEPSVRVIRRSLECPQSDLEKRLGGHVLLHDLNLLCNGLDSFEQLRVGDPFCVHNAAAVGFQESTPRGTLFSSCVGDDPDLAIDDIELDHHEFPDEPRDAGIVEGPEIDAEDL